MIFERGGLRWLESNGGPLMLLSRDLLLHWNGVDESMTQPDSDYARACAVQQSLELLEVGSGRGLVLGEEPMSTAWLPNQRVNESCIGLLVRWVCAENVAEVMRALKKVPDSIWDKSSLTLSTTDEAWLFDSAYPGYRVPEDARLIISLQAGFYSVSSAFYEAKPNVQLVLHRLDRR